MNYWSWDFLGPCVITCVYERRHRDRRPVRRHDNGGLACDGDTILRTAKVAPGNWQHRLRRVGRQRIQASAQPTSHHNGRNRQFFLPEQVAEADHLDDMVRPIDQREVADASSPHERCEFFDWR